jgi:hypothetical protein
MIREEQLFEFGFSKEVVPPEESGMDYEWYYYSYVVGNLDFISSESDVAEKYNGAWTVHILEGGIEFTDFEDLKKVIETLEIYAR